MAKVSVIIPVFNVEEHLERCLESVAGQTHTDLDIVLVDDGSTDASPRILKDFAQRDSRVRVISQPNAGVSAARNAGLDAATGDLVAFVDADDWLEPHTYKVLSRAIEERGVDLATCGYFVDAGESSRRVPVPDGFRDVLTHAEGLELVYATPNRFVFTRMFRRDLVDPVRFRTDIHWGEDTVFVVEASRRARGSVVVQEPLVHYVQSENSATRSAVNPKRLTGPAMTDVLESLVAEKHPHLVGHVIRTRVNIVSILIHDSLVDSPGDDGQQVRALQQILRGDLGRILRTPEVSMKTKAKATMLIVAPRAFVKSLSMLQRLRSRRD